MADSEMDLLSLDECSFMMDTLFHSSVIISQQTSNNAFNNGPTAFQFSSLNFFPQLSCLNFSYICVVSHFSKLLRIANNFMIMLLQHGVSSVI